MKNTFLALVFAAIVVVAGGPSGRQAHAESIQVVQINLDRPRIGPLRPGDSLYVRYMLIEPGDADPNGSAQVAPSAVLMLFPGGPGTLYLQMGQQSTGSTNFLVRTRSQFAAAGYIVAVVDAASDFLAHRHRDSPPDAHGFRHGAGLKGHREPNRLHGKAYVHDLSAVMSNLRRRYPNLPLWAVGTSRGTESAVVAATAVKPPPDGIVLTSTLTGPSSFGDVRSIKEFITTPVRMPVLIVSHQEDLCEVTKPSDSLELGRRLKEAFARLRHPPEIPPVKVRFFRGGLPPIDLDPCDPRTAHGFYGIEQRVIDFIASWIRHPEAQQTIIERSR